MQFILVLLHINYCTISIITINLLFPTDVMLIMKPAQEKFDEGYK